MSCTDVVVDMFVYLRFHRFVLAGIGAPDGSDHIAEVDGILCPCKQVSNNVTTVKIKL